MSTTRVTDNNPALGADTLTRDQACAVFGQVKGLWRWPPGSQRSAPTSAATSVATDDVPKGSLNDSRWSDAEHPHASGELSAAATRSKRVLVSHLAAMAAAIPLHLPHVLHSLEPTLTTSATWRSAASPAFVLAQAFAAHSVRVAPLVP
jgi:hypothetical protein